jgi:hypothetical protein
MQARLLVLKSWKVRRQVRRLLARGLRSSHQQAGQPERRARHERGVHANSLTVADYRDRWHRAARTRYRSLKCSCVRNTVVEEREC